MDSVDSSRRDELALVRAAEHDRAAKRAVLERVAGRLLSIALRMTGDRDEAEDISQEALAHLCRRGVLSAYRGEGPLDAYLLSVGTRTMVSALRRASALTGPTTTMEAPPERQAPALDADPIDPALRQAFDALPERARLVVLLLAVGDLTYRDVAVALDLELGTVKSVYSRARGALRESLDATA